MRILKIFAILSFLFMSGCVEVFTGHLTVRQGMEYTVKGDETATLSPGSYQTALRFNQSTAVFEFKISGANRLTRTLMLKASKNTRLPERSGSFSIGATAAGHLYTLSGNQSSETSTSETVRDFEFCTVQRMFTDCTGAPDIGCRQVWRTSHGNQPVKYYFDRNLKKLSIQITLPGRGEQVAAFEGESGSQRKIYTYRGQCFPESR